MSKALILAEISRILSSGKLFLSQQGQQEFLAELFLTEKQSWFFDDMPTYSEQSSKQAKKLAEENNIPLTVDYTDANLESEAIAYYRIKGMIMGESSWWFSTKQFNDDLKAAEENPMIMSHFLHVNSGGGDTWYLDVAWKTLMDLKKPTIALIERVGASAAIYLTCPCKSIYAATQNEILGSIGTMVSFLDFMPYYESMGVKKIEEYATKSDLKNKKFNDLLKGGTHAKQFIEEELDPLQQQFEAAVRKARTKPGALEEKHPLFRGETYATQAASELGLIDGQKSLAEALLEAYTQGQQHIQKNRSAFRYLNSNFK
jgi:ClpP class serine protease